MTRSVRTTAACLSLMVALAACGAGLEPRSLETAAAPSVERPTASTAVGPADQEEAEPSAGAILQVALDETASAESGRFEWVIAYDTGAAPDFGLQEVRGTGEFAEAGDRVHLSMTSVPEELGVIDEVVVDGAAYLSVPDLGCERVDLAELLDGVALEGGGAIADPSAMLSLLEGVGSGVTDEGDLDIRGVATRHLQGSFTTRAALDTVRGAAAAQLDSMFAGMPDEFLDAEQQVDVFVDENGLLRRMQIAAPAARLDGETIPPSTTILDYFDFGEEIAIEAPGDCPGFTPPDVEFVPVEPPADLPDLPTDGSGGVTEACAEIESALAMLPPSQRDELVATLPRDLADLCPGVFD